jgi:hypothetical protein
MHANKPLFLSLQVIVLFTDGLSLDDPQPIAAELRARNVDIYAAVLAPDAYLSEVYGVAQFVYNSSELNTLTDALVNAADRSAKLYTPEN